jgi:hypothetical protein
VLSPTVINFPDANPTTTPSIPADSTVSVTARPAIIPWGATRLAVPAWHVHQGSTGLFGVTCTQHYRQANNWSYRPGDYTQVITITATSP